MGVVKFFALAGATAMVSTATFAADFPPAMPQPQVYAPADTGGWYLRGDIGVGAQEFKSFDFTQTNVATGGAWPATWRIATSPARTISSVVATIRSRSGATASSWAKCRP